MPVTTAWLNNCSGRHSGKEQAFRAGKAQCACFAGILSGFAGLFLFLEALGRQAFNTFNASGCLPLRAAAQRQKIVENEDVEKCS